MNGHENPNDSHKYHDENHDEIKFYQGNRNTSTKWHSTPEQRHLMTLKTVIQPTENWKFIGGRFFKQVWGQFCVDLDGVIRETLSINHIRISWKTITLPTSDQSVYCWNSVPKYANASKHYSQIITELNVYLWPKLFTPQLVGMIKYFSKWGHLHDLVLLTRHDALPCLTLCCIVWPK